VNLSEAQKEEKGTALRQVRGRDLEPPIGEYGNTIYKKGTMQKRRMYARCRKNCIGRGRRKEGNRGHTGIIPDLRSRVVGNGLSRISRNKKGEIYRAEQEPERKIAGPLGKKGLASITMGTFTSSSCCDALRFSRRGWTQRTRGWGGALAREAALDEQPETALHTNGRWAAGN